MLNLPRDEKSTTEGGKLFQTFIMRLLKSDAVHGAIATVILLELVFVPSGIRDIKL